MHFKIFFSFLFFKFSIDDADNPGIYFFFFFINHSCEPCYWGAATTIHSFVTFLDQPAVVWSKNGNSWEVPQKLVLIKKLLIVYEFLASARCKNCRSLSD